LGVRQDSVLNALGGGPDVIWRGGKEKCGGKESNNQEDVTSKKFCLIA